MLSHFRVLNTSARASNPLLLNLTLLLLQVCVKCDKADGGFLLLVLVVSWYSFTCFLAVVSFADFALAARLSSILR